MEKEKLIRNVINELNYHTSETAKTIYKEKFEKHIRDMRTHIRFLEHIDAIEADEADAFIDYLLDAQGMAGLGETPYRLTEEDFYFLVAEIKFEGQTL